VAGNDPLQELEVEILAPDEMVDAGLEALREYHLGDDLREAVGSVFYIMLATYNLRLSASRRSESK